MKPISNDTVDTKKRAGAEVFEPVGVPSASPGSRTVAAGRQFVQALTVDLVELAVRLRRYLAPLASRISLYLSEPPLPLRQFRCGGRRLFAKSVSRASFAGASAAVLRRFVVGTVVLAVVGVLALSGSILWALHDLRLERPMKQATKPALVLEAAGGEPLGRIGPLKFAEVERMKFPEHLVQAVLSMEDRRFYSHSGFDLVGIARAARRNMAAGNVVEGGSTITQQLVRMRFSDRERTFTRKIREILTAIWLEWHLTKDEILTSYLNSVYMGADAHGVPAAAHLYFSKRVSELTLSEAAMLTGLIRAPSQLNPLRDLQVAQARAAVVLDAMVANGAINGETAAAAKREMATLKLSPEFRHARSWFADWVAQEGVQVTGSSWHSVRVRTTLDPRLQLLAETTINEVLARQSARARASQAALVALRPDGAVLAMVGGRDYGTSQFNRAVEANRHPGSAFKPFVYLAALRKGYSPQDVIDAGPVEIKGWQPENFGGREYGRVTLAEAFARSINTAAVRLAMDVGLNEVISAARDLGIDARLSAVPSLALGAVEVSLLDLTGAFASVRAGRLRVKPWGIAAFGADDQSPMRPLGPPIVGSGQTLQHQQPMTDLLRLVIERGTGRAAVLDGFAAGKTGTSQNHRDAWFIGFNEALVVGVWVGNDDGSPMEGVVGGTVPASIWKRFMTEATSIVGETKLRVADLPGRGATPAFVPEQQAAQRPNQVERSPTSATEARAPGHCNVDACARKYSSFNASDCTYQPYNGGQRRLCEMDSQSARTPSQDVSAAADRQFRQPVAPSPRRAESAPNERRAPERLRRPFETREQAPRDSAIEERSERGLGFLRRRESIPQERAEERPSRFPSFW
jgi:penicillin-binding protein 1A